MNRGSQYGLALASAILLILTFPNGILPRPLPWLAPVALAPLLVAVASARQVRDRFLLGYAAGIVYWFGICYWIQYVLAVNGGIGEAGGWGAFLLFCLAKAVHLGVFAAFAGVMIPRWFAIPALAALWVAIERTHGTFGFAWLALGDTGADMPLLMRLAPLTGVYGLSFVFAMFSAALAIVFVRRSRKELAWLGLVLVLPLLPSPPQSQADQTAVAVQPNIPTDADWTQQRLENTEQRLSLLSLQTALNPAEPRPAILLWPEVPAPFYYYTDPHFREQAGNLARLTRTPFLFGAVAYTQQNAPLNSAVLLDAAGQLVDRYDKMYLVPFGEFIPPFFGWIQRITKEAGDFVPGSRAVQFPLGAHRVAAFICYESAFPHLVREFANGGAEVLFNLSNDGYFGKSAARLQHLELVRMRAAENGRWIVRATNDGYTASIDPTGAIVRELPPYVEDAKRMPFAFVSRRTWYTAHGDWFVWVCALAAIAGILRVQVITYHSK